MEVSKTIFQQIKMLDPMAMWAWGADDFGAIPAGEFKGKYFDEILDWDGYRPPAFFKAHAGGLFFFVNGLKHKGKIEIFLNGSDYYDVLATSYLNTDGRIKVKSNSCDVFVGELMRVLDELIEGKKEVA